jgi:hypothetical protein
VGIVRSTLDLTGSDTTPVSPPVEVIRSTLDFADVDTSPISQEVGVLVQPVAELVIPNQLSQGSSNTLVVTGTGLNSVTSITLLSDQGVTQTTAFTVNADGTEITISIDVAVDADLGIRQLILQTATGQIHFSETSNNWITIIP